MKALVFRHSPAREAASAIGGRADRRAFVSGYALCTPLKGSTDHIA
jgi:hypothetical protein